MKCAWRCPQAEKTRMYANGKTCKRPTRSEPTVTVQHVGRHSHLDACKLSCALPTSVIQLHCLPFIYGARKKLCEGWVGLDACASLAITPSYCEERTVLYSSTAKDGDQKLHDAACSGTPSDSKHIYYVSTNSLGARHGKSYLAALCTAVFISIEPCHVCTPYEI